MSKSPRNPNGAPVADDPRTVPYAAPDDKGGLPHFEPWSKRGGDSVARYLHVDLSQERIDKVRNMAPSEREETVARLMRWRKGVVIPHDRTTIGRIFAEDLRSLLAILDGEPKAMVGSRGKTLEEHEATASERRADWLDPSKGSHAEPVTVDGTPTGDLKPEIVQGKTYPPSNPNHPEHQLWLEQEAKRRKRSVESLKASEERRRKEQAAKKGGKYHG